MDDATLAHHRRRLEARAAELDALDDGGAAGATVTLDQQRVGRLSRADALQAQAMAKATRSRRQAERRRIERALARLERDEYGHCLECDEPIGAGRLEVDPAAERCIACADAAS